MKDIKSHLASLNFSSLGVEYADVRIEETIETHISYQKGELKEATESPSLGAFLRVFNEGNWVYKSTTHLDSLQDDLLELSKQVELLSKKKQKWPHREPLSFENSRYEKTGAQSVSLEKKKNICESLIPILEDEPLVQGPRVSYRDMYKKKWFRSSDQREFYYDYSQAGVAIFYSLKRGENIFEDYETFFITDFEKASQELPLKTRRRLDEASLFIDAPSVTPGKYTVVLDQGVTGVFTHESFGHKSEADFMLGDEKMKEEWKIGQKVGSDILSIVDDGHWPETTGYVPIDDEGNIKEKTYLIKDGKLMGRLHSTSTAQALDEAPTGNARAMNFMFEPIVRMTNTYIEAGKKNFEELIAPIENGLYVKGVNHGMGMSTFTIAPQMAYVIKNGKLTSPVKVSLLSGSVFETLNKIKDIGSDFSIHSSASGGCGKMEQFPLPVADGGPSIVVEGMNVG